MPKIDIIFEDEWMIAVHKPVGMFVHRTDGWDRDRTPLLQHVRNLTGQHIYTIHRLDRATSGLVLMGKTAEASSVLHEMFRERKIAKTYSALVRGFCDQAGTIDIPLRPRQPNSANKLVAQPETERPEQDCCTHYQTVRMFELPFQSTRYQTTRCSLLTLKPETGRWHQIRRHVNRILHPVIGDTTHGDNTQNRFFRQKFGLTRLMLAATELQFRHPWTADHVRMYAEPSADFQTILEQIEPYTVQT